MTASAFYGGGDLYINRVDPKTGLKVGRAGPFECAKFEIKPNVDIKEKVSKGRNTTGQVIASVAIQKPTDLTVVLSQMDRDGLMLALLGTSIDINQGAGTLTDVPIVAKLDKWVSLPNQNLAEAGLVVKNGAGTTTFVLGTHYLVNYRLGMIKALSSGTIAEGDELKISGSYLAVSGTKIAGGTQTQLNAEFVLDGVNFVDQSPVICTALDVVLAPDSGFDFLADEFGNITLKGRMVTPAGMSAPFTVELLDLC